VNYHINFDDSSSKQKLYNYLKMLDGTWNIKIERPKKDRSIKENNYYHGVVVKMIADEVGELPETIHEELKYMFLKYEGLNKLNGETEWRVKSTTELSTVEMEEYLEYCRVWAHEFLELVIPLPNQVI
jgi:hypothetical protein